MRALSLWTKLLDLFSLNLHKFCGGFFIFLNFSEFLCYSDFRIKPGVETLIAVINADILNLFEIKTA